MSEAESGFTELGLSGQQNFNAYVLIKCSDRLITRSYGVRPTAYVQNLTLYRRNVYVQNTPVRTKS